MKGKAKIIAELGQKLVLVDIGTEKFNLIPEEAREFARQLLKAADLVDTTGK